MSQPEFLPPASGDPELGLEWRKLHPITPLINGWSLVLVIFLVFGSQNIESWLLGGGSAEESITDGIPGVVLFWIIASVIVVVGTFFFLSWRRLAFAISDEAVHLHSGILFRRRRQARLDRLQAVDTVQPLLARIFGLIELRIEVAGGSGESAVALGFLTQEQAFKVRNEILLRAAGLPAQGAPDTQSEPLPVPEAPERFVYEVPLRSIMLGVLLSWPMLALVLVAVLFAVGTRLSGEGGMGGLAFVLLFPAGAYVVAYFVQNFAFTAAASADGIRLRSGLLEKRSQTVPPGRVQAIEFSQSWLWRRAGLWRVQVNVAGYGPSNQSQEQNRNVILPAGKLDQAMLAAWLVLPDPGVADPATLMSRLLSGRPGPELALEMNPRRSAWLDLISWRWNGFTVTEKAVVVVHGRLNRRVVFVPHERLQSLGLKQGPLQRRLRLATVELHSVSGPVNTDLPHLDQEMAAQFLATQPQRSDLARQRDTSERWMAQHHD